MFTKRWCGQLATAGGVVLLCAVFSPRVFADLVPVVTNGSLSGFVYADVDNDGQRMYAPGKYHQGLAGVAITLLRYDLAGIYLDSRNTTTGLDGKYLFDKLPAGRFSIYETELSNFIDGNDTVGYRTLKVTDLITGVTTETLPNPAWQDPGTVANSPNSPTKNAIINVYMPDNAQGYEYNFGEYSLKAAYVSKQSYLSDTPVNPVPEPTSLMLLICGGLSVGGCALARRRRAG